MKHNLFSFLRRGLQIRRNFSTTCTTLGTRGENLQADAALCGRSMVEMLGVLAIIGVLSVGAMTGYSKAMMKYKLNKQTEQINQIMMALIEYKSVLSTLKNSESVVSLFRKLNALPPEMLKRNENYYIYDVFNTPVELARSSGGTAFYFSFLFTGRNDQNHTICRNILESFKGYAAELHAVGINSNTSESVNQQDWWFGDQAKTDVSQKIHMLNLEKMQNLCQKCDSNACSIYAIFSM